MKMYCYSLFVQPSIKELTVKEIRENMVVLENGEVEILLKDIGCMIGGTRIFYSFKKLNITEQNNLFRKLNRC